MPTERKTPQFVAKVREALVNKRHEDAVSILVDGLARSAVRQNGDLTPWLSREFGAAGARKLLQTLTHFPCFYCKRGLTKCTACTGRGHVAGDWPCDTCLALGYSRCDFCDGSGWVTYNFIPMGLRLSVIIARVQAAASELKVLLQQPEPPAMGGSAKEVASQLLALNRLAGIFENALDATRAFRNSGAAGKQVVHKIRKTCLISWKKLAPRIRACLKSLHAAAARQAASGPESKRIYAERKADLYEKLANAKRLAGTGTAIDHPFLTRAAART